MKNSTKQLVGLFLIAIFVAILTAITFFPERSGTAQQQFNGLTASLIQATIGILFITAGRERSKKMKPQKF